ncbi:MAG: ABC transporter substrate-binding protein [Acidobacteriota bacterium]|nr:ABC transporter substrate-binding protein [Acidobacteriota bacterium]
MGTISAPYIVFRKTGRRRAWVRANTTLCYTKGALVLITGSNWKFCGRKWTVRPTGLCVVAIGIFLLSGGCAPKTERSYLVILTEGIPPTLDPLAALDSRVDNPVINLYSALVQYIPGTTELSLDLAESYEISDDGRRYVFTLRPDAVFHDGTPVRAADVKYCIDRMLTLKTGVWAYLTPVSGAEILDDRRVAIDLYEPFHGLLGALTRFYVANSELVRTNEFQGDLGQRWLQNHDAGSGPYSLVSFQPEQQFTVERFYDYHGGWGDRHIEKAVFRVIREEAARRIALRNGDADWIYLSSADTLEALAGEPGIKVNRDPTLNQLYIAFNTRREPLRDARVRRALALAYDYQGHVEHLMRGNAEMPYGVLPARGECASPDQPIPRYDLVEARRLIAEAGVLPGDVELTMAFEGTTGETPFFEIMRAGAAELGIRVTAVDIEWDAKVSNYSRPDSSTDIGTIWLFAPGPEAHHFLYSLAHSSQAGDGGNNFAWYQNPVMDRLLDEAAAATEEDRRCSLYRQVEALWLQEMPFAVAVTMVGLSAQRDDLKGYSVALGHPLTQNLYPMWFE